MDGWVSSQAGASMTTAHKVPAAKIDGTTITLDANLAAHVELRSRLQQRRQNPTRQSTDQRSPKTGIQPEQRYSLQIQNQPLGPIVTQLAERLGLSSDLSAINAADQNQLISFQVANATTQELFQAVVSGTEFQISIDDKTVRVAPR